MAGPEQRSGNNGAFWKVTTENKCIMYMGLRKQSSSIFKARRFPASRSSSLVCDPLKLIWTPSLSYAPLNSPLLSNHPIKSARICLCKQSKHFVQRRYEVTELGKMGFGFPFEQDFLRLLSGGSDQCDSVGDLKKLTKKQSCSSVRILIASYSNALLAMGMSSSQGTSFAALSLNTWEKN